MNITEHFIRDSHNQINITLTEDGSAISDTPTEILIDIGGVVSITRTPTGDGVAYSAGVVTITPSSVNDDLTSLVDGAKYLVKVLVKTATEPNGVIYGGNDSDARLYFIFSTLPS